MRGPRHIWTVGMNGMYPKWLIGFMLTYSFVILNVIAQYSGEPVEGRIGQDDGSLCEKNHPRGASCKSLLSLGHFHKHFRRTQGDNKDLTLITLTFSLVFS